MASFVDFLQNFLILRLLALDKGGSDLDFFFDAIRGQNITVLDFLLTVRKFLHLHQAFDNQGFQDKVQLAQTESQDLRQFSLGLLLLFFQLFQQVVFVVQVWFYSFCSP